MDIDKEALYQARKYLVSVQESGVKYEGAILNKKYIEPLNVIKFLIKGAYAEIKRKFNVVYRRDNHLENYFLLQLYEKVINPITYYIQHKVFRNKTLNYKELDQHGPFVFYPLHFEPEVSIQVTGRPYQNQIELIRNIALNLPAGMKVLVKEHPRSKGFRSMSYYRKLLEMPNVRMVDISIPTNIVVKHASLVSVISGSTGLEAAIIGRPVLTFGLPPYNVLPSSMVRHVKDLNRLGWEIKDLLKSYLKDEKKLERYISAFIKGSAPVDLYTVLLSKSGRLKVRDNQVTEIDSETEEYKVLSNYFNKRIQEVLGDVLKQNIDDARLKLEK